MAVTPLAIARETRTHEFPSRVHLRSRHFRSASYWLIESLRFAHHLVHAILVPACLIWPAVVLWGLWFSYDGDLGEAVTRLASGDEPHWAAVYGVGATLHAMTRLWVEPYQSERQRRIDALRSRLRNQRRRHT